VTSSKIETINEDKFQVGYSFILEDMLWTITKREKVDNTDLITITSKDGTEEILMLTTLKKHCEETSL
jgi:hypothetical protein